MTLLMRLTVTMAALVLAMTVALGLLADRSFDLPVLFAGLAVELGILILTVMVAHYYLSGPLVEMAAPSRTLPQAAPEPARICPKGEIGIVARAFDRMAEEKGDKSCKLDLEGDKRRRTEALEQYAGRERMFIAAVESASHPVIAKALDGTITAWNPAAERLYQYTAGEAIGSDIDIIIPPERRDEQLVIVDKIRREEPVENFETVRMAKDGRRIDVAVSVSPVVSPNGEIIGLAEITRDITAQDFAEEKFRLAVEACPSGMVMIGAAGKVVLVNSEIERLFGYRRDELIGRSVDILVPERFRGQHVRHREGFLRTPQTRRMGAGRDLFGRRKDGTEFPVEVGLNPIETREGPLVLSVIVDITERKRMERLKDEFVSTVSHELRTPLTSITGSLGLLMGGVTGKMTERAVHLLAIAHSNSQRLVRLVNDILDIEKMESGQLNFNLARVDVRALVEQIVEANRGFAEGYGVRIRIDPATAEGEVHADPDRLAQVITNLLSNAVKISPSDDEVVLAIERRSDVVRISVQDRGPGIPAQFKPHVFEKFAQADATNARQKGGTGLGLSIVKEIVARLGGEVGFEDAPQGGTVFHVDLPSWDHAASREIDIDGAPDATRILLCEDHPETAIAMRERLRQAGFVTDFAYTAADALARAVATPYGAFLVDLKLSDGDGISLIVALRELPQYQFTPIVVVSADARGGREDQRSSDLEVLDWFSKPVDFERLGRTLRRTLDRRAADTRPRVLHVDDDCNVLELAAAALGPIVEMVSVTSLDAARRAIEEHKFDLAILDLTLAQGSGLDLLPDLRDRGGYPIPVIVFSAQDGVSGDGQVEAALNKSHASFGNLISCVEDRLALPLSRAVEEVA